ncbi:MAG: hypothetical protein WCH34_17375 [Bacteroidota bacterium]
MDLLEKKIRLIAHCKVLIDEKISTIQFAMDDAQQSANEYGLPKDRYDSFRAQILRKKDMFGQQLIRMLDERNMLDKINIKKSLNTVEFGAVVKTNHQTLFIAIGLGKIHFEEEDIFVISPSVPLYKAIIGKKQGEKYSFNNIENSLIEIF